MLLFWIMGTLFCITSAAVLPRIQISPFEDPPPNQFSYIRKEETSDDNGQYPVFFTQQDVASSEFPSKREVPLEATGQAVEGYSELTPEEKVVSKDSYIIEDPLERYPQRQTVVTEIQVPREWDAMLTPDQPLTQKDVMLRRNSDIINIVPRGFILQPTIQIVETTPSRRSPNLIGETAEASVVEEDVLEEIPQRFLYKVAIPVGNSEISPQVSADDSAYDLPEKGDSQQEIVNALPEKIVNPDTSISVSSGVISVVPEREVTSKDTDIKSKQALERRLHEDIALKDEVISDYSDTKTVQKRSTKANAPIFTLTDAPRYFSQLSRQKRTSSPAVDSVDDNPSHWNLPKAQFITKRGPSQQVLSSARTYNVPDTVNPSYSAGDISSARSNDVILLERDRPGSLSQPRSYEYHGERDSYDNRRLAPRRIIYYATLPEIVRPLPPDVPYRNKDSVETGDYSRYDLARAGHKFPRESRYEDTVVRPSPAGIGRDDRYRYRGPNSYTIIDSERAPVRAPPRTPYPARQYPDVDFQSRYNRIPSPYQQNQPTPTLEQYRKPSGTVPLRFNPAPAPGRRDEPYRDYNPHQPAHWSMQVGTSLTVKDDGRPYNSGRRFYVHSQDQTPYSPSRYPRIEDDPRHRL